MAEGFLKLIAKNNNDFSLDVLSRGVVANEGAGASEFSVMAANEFGADISTHTSHQLTVDDVCDADLILTVTVEHCMILRNEFKSHAHKVFSVKEFAGCDDIADPYGGDFNTYKNCASQLIEACKIIYNKVNGNNK